MTIHDIVANLYTDRRVREFIAKQEPADLQDDLFHHCILEICRMHEKYPGKIESLHQSNQIFAFFVGMVRNQNWSEKSTFFSRFKKGHEPEEIYLDNADLIKCEESSKVANDQIRQDDEAEQKFGAKFVAYFYDNFHNRKTKQSCDTSLQLSLF